MWEFESLPFIHVPGVELGARELEVTITKLKYFGKEEQLMIWPFKNCSKSTPPWLANWISHKKYNSMSIFVVSRLKVV